ncbi:MAG: aminopeptidase P family N-terminal domain-containing protein, partial [Paracoccaceae bacterium]|nr:aminopeptidase P family N-terminal domain-containing protein [Paracoccaceae bacterium]
MSDFDTALRTFSPVSAPAITVAEHGDRLNRLASAMRGAGVNAVWLDAASSLTYYTGLSLHPSERIHGALVLRDGSLAYVTPNFERPKLESMLRLPGTILVWEEHEDPFALFAAQLTGRQALDPETPLRFASRMSALPGLSITWAETLI